MKKSNLLLIIGLFMVMAAVCFVIFALNNPQSSFPWSNTITYGIYIVYAIAAIFFILKGLQKKYSRL